MAKHIDLGKSGEQVAYNFLVKKGYKILHRNWHYKHKEIDIIAEKDDMLVIVEVKIRSGDYFELPHEAVTKKKQRFIIDATDAYIQEYDINKEVQFDIISIIPVGKTNKIEHIEDAFTPIF